MKPRPAAPLYTSANQFANMLDRRGEELRQLMVRIMDHGALEDAAECVSDAIDDLTRAAEKLRDYHARGRAK